MLKSLICVLALAATATAANAESMSVKTNDLDLSTDAGLKKLDQRVTMAARKICKSSESNTGSRLESKASTDCVKRAVSEARERFAVLNARSSS